MNRSYFRNLILDLSKTLSALQNNSCLVKSLCQTHPPCFPLRFQGYEKLLKKFWWTWWGSAHVSIVIEGCYCRLFLWTLLRWWPLRNSSCLVQTPCPTHPLCFPLRFQGLGKLPRKLWWSLWGSAHVKVVIEDCYCRSFLYILQWWLQINRKKKESIITETDVQRSRAYDRTVDKIPT